MASLDEGLGPDSDDDFEVWMLGSDDLLPIKQRTAAEPDDKLPVIDDTRSEQELSASYALAAEDALSYLQVLKCIRLRMMNDRAAARNQFLLTAKQAVLDEQIAKSEAAFSLEYVLEGAELRSNSVKQP